MIVFFAVLCLLCIPQIKFAREGEYHPDYLLVYLLENNILTLTLVDTGSHSDIFNN